MDNSLEVLFSKLEAESNIIVETLGAGGPKDYAEYRYLVGVVRGLHIGQSLVNDLAKNMEQYDE
jgi:hypothetical protein